ncbi:hypothetical protein WJ97_13815 [Burkholderia ubonensis]|nr:hypothetical protein WJ97_13815 [Burkholderia ubonensis]
MYSLFLKEAERWYPDGKKRVPFDLVLTPISLAHWYCGDGYRCNSGYIAAFATDGFSTECVESLMQKMRESFGFSPGYEARRNRIQLGTMPDRVKFLELVTPYMPKCFAYKLQLQTGADRMKLTPALREKLFNMHVVDGWTYEALMAEFDMSKSGVASAIKRHQEQIGAPLPQKRGRPLRISAPQPEEAGKLELLQ